MFSYDGKKAIVTGAGRGIGRAIALAFAGQGADVTLAARSHGSFPNLDFADAVCVARMKHEGIAEIYSYDGDFDAIPGVRRIEP